jgi:hypothetical protein
MTIKPTREEWLEARKRVAASRLDADVLAEAALGPCPPAPPPAPWCSSGPTEVRLGASAKEVWVGIPGMAHELLDPKQAIAMAEALVEHASYAHEQAALALGASPLQTPASEAFEPCGHDDDEELSVCRQTVVSRHQRGRCQRPKGHDGPHDVWPRPGDSYARKQEEEAALIKEPATPEPVCGRVLDTLQISGLRAPREPPWYLPPPPDGCRR